MTRNEAAYELYRCNRYMQHLTDAELAERLDYCANIGVGLKDGKVAMSNPIEGMPEDYPFFNFEWQKWADVLEEYRLRGDTTMKEVDLPSIGPRLMNVPKVDKYSIRTTGIDYRTEAVTGLGQRIVDAVEFAKKKYSRCFVIVKYGQKQHMEQLAKDGVVRIGTAKGFENDANHARQDHETCFEMNHAGKGRWLVRCGDYWLWCCTVANEGPLWVARCVHDFAANAAVVIVDGTDFLYEMRNMMRQKYIGMNCQIHPVIYSDPLLDKVKSTEIPFTKHFRYMYQREQRIVWIPILPFSLEPVFLNVRAGLQRYLVV